MVRGDRYEIQQVLLNLLTNAVHALSGLPATTDRRILVATGREGDRSFVRVTDTGAGIPAALTSRIFTPFFTTKDPGQGTGLGLSISYGIVESHGGRLSYAPADGGGATFTIHLPAHDAAERRGTARLLVVDADRTVHRAVTAVLAQDGVEVHAARSAAEALAMVREQSYDVVVLDPTLSGTKDPLVTSVLAERPELASRMVLLGDGAADGSRELPEAPRLAKPLVPREARAVLHRLLGR
jgi:CheY-like chemotaxis protein/anti-sigma regulatory factor (Ser/Thr protein kinase)